MRGPTAPKDPESRRPFFYIMREKEIFGSIQPDGRGIQFIYEDSGRLISSARIAGNVTDEEELSLMKSTEGFRRLVHSIGVSVESDDPAREVVFAFQMYGKNDPMGGGTTLRKTLRTDGAEVRIVLDQQEWSADDKEPGQIRFEFAESEIQASVSVRFFLNDGFEAPELTQDEKIDYASETYREMIARSLMQSGDSARLLKAIEKAGRGEDVTIAYIGGSITQGAGAIPINSECYAYKSYQHFAKRFGKGDNVHFVKAGVGGTPSELGMIRFERDVLRDGAVTPDIVVVEFAVNDEGDETKGNCYESLVRKILMLPNAPAVVLLFAVFADDWNLQDRLGVVGERYRLPMVSVLNAVTPQFRLKTGEGRVLSKNQFFYDMFHPTNAGHTIMADCLMYCFEEAAKQGGSAVPSKEPLPEPVIGADFVDVRLLDKKDMPKDAVVTPGSFLFVDDKLQCVEMNEDLTGTPEFPHNWMYDGKQVKQGGDFTLEITCRALLLIFKDSGELDAGRAQVFVDGEKKLTADPHINGWIHCNPVILIQEKETKRHKISIRMEAGEEEKKFTILGFGYVS